MPPKNELPNCTEQENGIGYQIAFPQTTRLRTKTVKPFQTEGLHPLRSSLNRASMVIKCGPHTNHHSINPAAVCRHPPLLLRTTQAYPYGTSARRINSLHIRRILFSAQDPKRGRNCPRNLQTWKRC